MMIAIDTLVRKTDRNTGLYVQIPIGEAVCELVAWLAKVSPHEADGEHVLATLLEHPVQSDKAFYEVR